MLKLYSHSLKAKPTIFNMGEGVVAEIGFKWLMAISVITCSVLCRSQLSIKSKWRFWKWLIMVTGEITRVYFLVLPVTCTLPYLCFWSFLCFVIDYRITKMTSLFFFFFCWMKMMLASLNLRTSYNFEDKYFQGYKFWEKDENNRSYIKKIHV